MSFILVMVLDTTYKCSSYDLSNVRVHALLLSWHSSCLILVPFPPVIKKRSSFNRLRLVIITIVVYEAGILDRGSRGVLLDDSRVVLDGNFPFLFTSLVSF